MLRAFPPKFKAFLQKKLFDASCVNTDFLLDKIARDSRHTRALSH